MGYGIAKRARTVALVSVVVAATLLSGRLPATAADPDPNCITGPTPSGTRILTLGDSMTRGADGDYTWRYFTWKHLVQNNVPVDFVGATTDQIDPINSNQNTSGYLCPFDEDHSSFPGYQLAQFSTPTKAVEDSPIYKALNTSTGTLQADVLIIFAGLTDLTRAPYDGSSTSPYTPQQLLASAKAAVTEAQDANPDIKIILTDVPTADSNPSANSVSYNSMLASAVGTPGTVGGMQTATSTVVIADPEPHWGTHALTYDGEHPNAQGEVSIAAAFDDALHQLGVGPAATAADTPDMTAYLGPHSTATLDTPGAGAGTGNQVSLTWHVPIGPTAVQLQRTDLTTGSPWTVIVQSSILNASYGISCTTSTPPYQCTFTDTTLQTGDHYEYRVRLAKGYELPTTDLASNVVDVTAPGVAAVPHLTGAPGIHRATLTWGAVPAATGYRVSWRKHGTSTLSSRDVTTTSSAITGLEAGQPYDFLVRAVDGAALGPVATVVATPKANALQGSARPVLSSVAGHKIHVRWSATAGANRYLVQYRLVGGAWKTLVVTTARAVTTRALVKNKSYDVRIRAYDGLVGGTFSAAARFKVK
ncbi:MAG: fibronectin, type [Marmoricola sp.]|nr:fibronectin, type [Marmoricola sp.]